MTDHTENPSNEAATAAATAESGANVNLAALVTEVVKFLVDSPDEVSVEEVNQGSHNVVLNLSVAQNDVGKVIGKQGRTVRSLRNLVDAAASRLNKRATLEIIEDEEDSDDDDQDGDDENFGNRA